MIKEFPVELTRKAATPANKQLFDSSKGKTLSPLKSEAFHTFVMKALFLTMRARPNIKLTVMHPCARVQAPTSHDWLKLVRLMNCH